LKISAFVDDTALLNLINRHLSHCIPFLLQSDAQLWEKLLFTSGGKLEIPKCKYSVLKWKFDSFGQASLLNESSEDLTVVCSKTKQTMIIPYLSTNQAYKYVGLQIALDGDMREQVEDLHDKCNKLALVFTQSYFDPTDAAQGFMTIYGPIVKYPLSATSISESKMASIQ
jgi:hypothetical protein